MSYKSSLCLSLLLGLSTMSQAQERLLVSGYSDTVQSYTVENSADGPVIRQAGQWPVDPNLTWLELTDTLAYAIHEVSDFEGTPGGAVSRWEMGEDSWERQEWVSTESPGPAHLAVNQEHGLAYVSNYGGGSLTVISMQGEKLDKVKQVEHFQGCRDDSHPHQVVTSGPWVWLVDLGCDVIRTYKAENGAITLVGTTEVDTFESGYGPRHLALGSWIDRDDKPNRLYLVCELIPVVQMYSIDDDTGSLKIMQEIDLTGYPPNPPDSTGAEILVRGEKIYASSRGGGVVVVFGLNWGGGMGIIQEFDLEGTWPRHMGFCQDGGMLAVIDQKGDTVQVLAVDKETGLLSKGGVAATPPGPAFVAFY